MRAVGVVISPRSNGKLGAMTEVCFHADFARPPRKRCAAPEQRVEQTVERSALGAHPLCPGHELLDVLGLSERRRRPPRLRRGRREDREQRDRRDDQSDQAERRRHQGRVPSAPLRLAEPRVVGPRGARPPREDQVARDRSSALGVHAGSRWQVAYQGRLQAVSEVRRRVKSLTCRSGANPRAEDGPQPLSTDLSRNPSGAWLFGAYWTVRGCTSDKVDYVKSGRMPGHRFVD
jgi:hypothetical protein